MPIVYYPEAGVLSQGPAGPQGPAGTSGLENMTRFSPVFSATGMTFTTVSKIYVNGTYISG